MRYNFGSENHVKMMRENIHCYVIVSYRQLKLLEGKLKEREILLLIFKFS